MEFIKENYVSTITSITYATGTLTVANLINPDYTFQWLSDGFNDDSLPTELVFSFDETMTVSRIMIKEHNLKQFRLYYNGVTANAFAMTTTAMTTTSIFNANTDTAHYFTVDPVDCTSVTLQMDKTSVANSEKALGYIYISDSLLTFSRIPNHQGWKPKVKQNNVMHKLSDGSFRNHKINKKFSAQIKLSNITKAFRDNLETIYDRLTPYAFCAFETSTAWDEMFYGCIWSGDFDFYQLGDTAIDAGYDGIIRIAEST